MHETKKKENVIGIKERQRARYLHVLMMERRRERNERERK